MENSDYPQRLLLHKIEEDENLDGQTHYFKICDEGGTVINDTDWYPIDSGHLQVEVTNLQFDFHMNSTPLEEEELDQNRESKGMGSRQVLRGDGKLLRGSTQDPLTGYDVCLSHFGNDNQYRELKVFINVWEDRREHFVLGGIERIVDIGVFIEESFSLSIFMDQSSFDSLKDNVLNTDPKKLSVSLNLSKYPGLYTQYSSWMGNEYGVIKQFYPGSGGRVHNLDQFDESYIDQIFSGYYSPKGYDFQLSLSKEVDSSLTHTDETEEEGETWSDLVTDTFERKNPKEVWKEEFLEGQRLINKRLIYILVVGVLILGQLWFSSW